jgi:hypothetical protein
MNKNEYSHSNVEMLEFIEFLAIYGIDIKYRMIIGFLDIKMTNYLKSHRKEDWLKSIISSGLLPNDDKDLWEKLHIQWQSEIGFRKHQCNSIW